MTDAQLTILLSTVGAIATAAGALVRWGVGRIVKALDDNTLSNRELAKESTRLSTQIDILANWAEERSDVGPPPRPPRKTPAEGMPSTTYSYSRSRTRGENG